MKLEFEEVGGRVSRGGEDWVLLNLESFKALLLGVWEVFSSGAYTILLFAGQRMGGRLVEYLREKGLEGEEALARGLAGFLTETGWGRFEVEFREPLTFKVYDFALYRDAGRGKWKHCALIKGIISGFFSALWGKVSCLETQCILEGDECCEFKVQRKG